MWATVMVVVMMVTAQDGTSTQTPDAGLCDAERADKRVAQLAKQKELSASLASKRANEEAARKEFDGPYLAVVNDKAAYYAKLGKKNLAVASRVTGKRGCNKQLKSCKPEDASL